MRELDLNDLRVFVRVIERGGFAVAARELGVPTSTVSRTIARLEASAGARLLQRNARSVQATSEGQAMYAGVGEAVAALERAARGVEPASRQPRGLLRVTAPNDIGTTFVADAAVSFGERYPQVQLELTLTNRAVGLVGERFDLAVRAATRLDDSSLAIKRLGHLEHAVYAAPAYLERRGAPATPDDLTEHRCIVFRGKTLEKTWRLVDGESTREVAVRAQLGGDDFGYVRAAVVAGGGLALMPRLVCARDEAAGRLIRVLPSWSAAGAELCLLSPSTSHVPARVAAFRDHLAAAFAAHPAARPGRSAAAPPPPRPGPASRPG